MKLETDVENMIRLKGINVGSEGLIICHMAIFVSMNKLSIMR